MRGISIFFFFVMVSTVQGAEIDQIFTKDFIRSSGAPIEETCHFDGINGSATFTVTNGDYENSAIEKVSSCIIYLNGIVLFDAANFNQLVPKIHKNARINLGDNILKVIMKGKPGERLNVSITQEAETIKTRETDFGALDYNPPPKITPKGPKGFKITGVIQSQRE